MIINKKAIVKFIDNSGKFLYNFSESSYSNAYPFVILL